MNLSRRQVLQWSTGLSMAALMAWPGRVAGGVLDRLFHGGPARPTTPITPNETFYLTSYRSPPTVRAKDWALDVSGLVARPLRLNYEEIVKRPSESAVVTLECIGNSVAGEYIGTAKWEGIPLRILLEEAGGRPEAVDVVFHAADGYSDSIPLARAMTGNVLVAHRMNDEPLPLAHGFPMRMIVPGHYGMKSVQWLTRIDLVDRDYQGYYQKKGWTDDAAVKTTSWIETPIHGSTVRTGRLVVGGIAFAGLRGIRQVELSVDEGLSWRPAVLDAPLGPAAWVFWRFVWDVTQAGSATLMVRATDGDRQVQSDEEQGPAPAGTTGLHAITVKVAA